MIIAVMSDSHNNIEKIRKAINIINSSGCKYIIHCGDFTTCDAVREFTSYSGTVHAVFGNNDDDMMGMRGLIDKELNNFQIMEFEAGEIEIEGKKIALTHYPHIAECMAQSEDYDVVFFGHTHISEIKNENKTLLINPGEILGENGESSFIFYNIVTREIEKVII